MDRKLSRVISGSTLLILTALIVLLGSSWLTYEYVVYTQKLHDIKNSNIQSEKMRLETDVLKAVSLAQFEHEQKMKLIKQSLKQKVYEANTLIDSLYNKYQGVKSKEEILELIKDALRDQRFYEGYGYFTIYALDGKNILHPIKPEIENSYAMKEFRDLKGKHIYADWVNLLEKQKEGFSSWTFYRPDQKEAQAEKIGYIKLFEPYELIISTADYLFRIENELKEATRQRIRNLRFSDEKYLFIVDLEQQTVSTGAEKRIENQPYMKMGNENLIRVIEKIDLNHQQNGNGFLEYKWYNPVTKRNEQKISYVYKFENWNWYVGSGFYLEKFNQSQEKELALLEDQMIKEVQYTIFSLVLFFVTLYLFTRYIDKQVSRNVKVLVEFFKNVNLYKKPIAIEEVSFQEFKELGKYANLMLEEKLKNEEVIDSKNKEVMINLSLLNEYKKAVDAAAIVSKTDINGVITFANDQFCKISGYKREELIGFNQNIVRHPAVSSKVFENLWQTIMDKRIWKGVLQNRAKDGTDYYVKSTIVPILDIDGHIKEFMAIRYDVTDLIKQSRRIKLQTTDHLTQLPNRQKLLEDLQNGNDLKLSLFNVDRFKQINDYYGFETGDLVLIEIAHILRDQVIEKPLKLYKLPGDEYAIMADERTSCDDFNLFCKQIVNLFNHYKMRINNNSFEIYLSAGTTCSKNYFTHAEIARDHAKAEGLPFVFFDENQQIKEQLLSNITWTQKLKKAIEEDRIVVFTQAIIDNATKKVNKHECLVRMIDEDGTVISPFKFLHIAKSSKLYSHITHTVIRKSFEYFASRSEDFSINLTIDDILSEETVTYLIMQLKKYDGIANRLILEIVEDEGIENYDKVSSFIETVKHLGCRIAIDDFGTGYSNFDYLMKLNVDFVKIDGSMIKYLDHDANAKVVTELIISFAKRLEIKTIAEFVHSETIHEIVTDMGIDYSQGFHLAEPKMIGS